MTSRGDRREDIYFGEADRLAWLEIFGQVCRRFNWICHAWCQMTNHYHVVVETVEGNLAQGVRYSLVPGMQVAAEIHLGTRTVLEYLLSPVSRAFHEAGRER